MRIKVGDYVYIKGEIEYGQDFSFSRGEFPHIIFYVRQVIKFMGGKIMYNLVAPGYGDVGNYGNGSIYINKKFKKQLKKIKGYLND